MGQTNSKSSGMPSSIDEELDTYQTKVERRIMLIGKTGTGKSTLGNAILGRQVFKNEGVQMQSNTTKCQIQQGKSFDGKDIVVLDSPGYMDTKRAKEEIIQELCQFAAMMAPGPHAVCLTIRGDDRFTQENVDTLDELCAFFGEDIYKYLIIVFTHKEAMGTNATTDDCLGLLPREFVHKYLTAGGKKIAIESTAEKKEVAKQVNELLKLVEEIVARNDGDYYSEEKFKVAEKAFRQRIPKIQQEVDKLFEGKKKSLEDEYKVKEHLLKNKENQLEEELQQTKEKFEQEKHLREKEKESQKFVEKQQEKLKKLEKKLKKEQKEREKIKEEYDKKMQEVNAQLLEKLSTAIIEDRARAREAVPESQGFRAAVRNLITQGTGLVYDTITGGIEAIGDGIAHVAESVGGWLFD